MLQPPAGRARTGTGPSSTYPCYTPPVTPAAPHELSILVLGTQQEGACLHNTGVHGAMGAQRKDQWKGWLFLRATQLCFPKHKPRALSIPGREWKPAVQEQPGGFVPRFCSQTSAAENCSFQEGQALPSAQRWRSEAVLQNKDCWRRTLFTSALRLCQTAEAAVQHAGLWRSIPTAVILPWDLGHAV